MTYETINLPLIVLVIRMVISGLNIVKAGFLIVDDRSLIDDCLVGGVVVMLVVTRCTCVCVDPDT